MPFPSRLPKEASSTTAGAWKKLFAAAESADRCGAAIRNHDTGVAIRVSIVQKGAAAPAASDPGDDTMYVVDPSTTYPLGAYANYQCDIYVRAEDDGEVEYLAWEVMSA